MSERSHWQEINELEAKLAAAEARAQRAESALRPFAALYDDGAAYLVGGFHEIRVKVEDIRRARAVLAQIEKEQSDE